MEDKLSKRYLIKLIANLVSTLAGAGMIAFVPSSLGPLAYGKFIYIQKFFSEFFNFIDMGSSAAFFIKLSAQPKRKELTLFYLVISCLIFFLGLLALIVIALFELDSILLPNIEMYYAYLGLFYLFMTWFSIIFIKISDAYAFTLKVEVIKILYKVLSFIFLILLVAYNILDLEMFLWFQIITIGIYLVFLISFLYRKKNIFIFKKNLLTKLVFKKIFLEFKEFCSPLIIHSLIVVFVNIFDIWILQSVSGTEQLAFYGIAFQISAIGFMVTNAMTPIITREFSKYYELNDINQIRRLFVRYIPMLFSMSTIFAVFIIFQSENILLIFTDRRYEDAKYPLIIMSFFFTYHINIKLIGSLLFAYHKTIVFRNIGVFYMFLGILLSVIFVYLTKSGATGLAIKMLLSQFIGSALIMTYACRLIKLNVYIQFKHQFLVLICFLIIGYLSFLITFNVENLFINITLYSIVYSLILLISIYFFPSLFSLNKKEIMSTLTKLKSKYVKA